MEPIKLTKEEWASVYEQLAPIVDRLTDEQKTRILAELEFELFTQEQES